MNLVRSSVFGVEGNYQQVNGPVKRQRYTLMRTTRQKGPAACCATSPNSPPGGVQLTALLHPNVCDFLPQI